MCVCVEGGGGVSVYQKLTGGCIVNVLCVWCLIMYHKCVCVCVWGGGGVCVSDTDW